MQNTRRRAILVLSALLGSMLGHSADTQPLIEKLQGRWNLDKIDGKDITVRPKIYFEIVNDAISGFDGCNTFGGTLSNPNRIRISQLYCTHVLPTFPLDLTNPLLHLTNAEVSSEKIILSSADNQVDAVFCKEI